MELPDHHFVWRKRDQWCSTDASPPQIRRGLHLQSLRHQQNERQLKENGRVQPRGWLSFQFSYSQIDFVFLQQAFGSRLIRVVQSQSECGIPSLMIPEQRRQMSAQDRGGRGESKTGVFFGPQLARDLADPAEKGRGKSEEFTPGGGECERAALKQLQAERSFELQDLAADGGLLNAIGNLAGGRADPAVPRDVIEKFEVMDIHPTCIV